MFSKLGSIKVAAAIVGISVSGFSGEAQAVTFNFTTTNSGYSLEKNFSAGGINLIVAVSSGTVIPVWASSSASKCKVAA